MTIISEDNRGIALINVFTVKPGKQQELLDFLIKSTREVMSHFPGFISANFHKSRDGKYIANYAQWESQEAWEDMARQANAQKEFEHVYTLADAQYSTYTVAFVCESSSLSARPER
jgi:antibiotic biosynthesis monooxygenase (ABM) superfamily enzyme